MPTGWTRLKGPKGLWSRRSPNPYMAGLISPSKWFSSQTLPQWSYAGDLIISLACDILQTLTKTVQIGAIDPEARQVLIEIPA